MGVRNELGDINGTLIIIALATQATKHDPTVERGSCRFPLELPGLTAASPTGGTGMMAGLVNRAHCLALVRGAV